MSHTSHYLFYVSYISSTVLCLIYCISWTVLCLIQNLSVSSYRYVWNHFGSVLIFVGNVFVHSFMYSTYFLLSQFGHGRCLFAYKQTKPLKYGQFRVQIFWPFLTIWVFQTWKRMQCGIPRYIYKTLVCFGRACAPVRCAHPSSSAHCHTKQGAARPPPPIAASLLIIRPPKIS